MYILTINPGSTSTKVALFNGREELTRTTLRHSSKDLEQFGSVVDQLAFRLDAIREFIRNFKAVATEIVAVVGRGGMLYPLESGTYEVNELMLRDLKLGVQGEHASNLGGMMAHRLAGELNARAFIVDPVAVDEFEPVARVSGIPQILRRSLSHALNIKAVAHRVAEDLSTPLHELNLLVAHLGGGISIAPLLKGRIVDVNNANEMGPLSPERTGGLPVGDVVELCFGGEHKSAREVKKQFSGRGGIVAYLGTNDMRQVERLMDNGDVEARLVWEAMAYQIIKEIGQMATVLCGNVDAIALTGGLAHSERLVNTVSLSVQFIAPVRVYPGEDELQALAEGAERVLTSKEKVKAYSGRDLLL